VVLVVQVGRLHLGIPIEVAVETMRPLPIVDGRAVVRGASLPVIDAAAVLGEPAGERARFVVVRALPSNKVLHVDAVDGVRDACGEMLQLGDLAVVRL